MNTDLCAVCGGKVARLDLYVRASRLYCDSALLV